jgi:hypothetical protein
MNIEFKERKFLRAINTNDVYSTKKIIKEIDPSFSNNLAIKIVSELGFLEITEILLNDPRIDPSCDHNYSISIASENNHFNVVNLLLKDSRVDPSDYKNSAIEIADKYENTRMLFLLWSDQRIKKTLKKDHLAIYNKLIKYDIQEKINSFD